MTIFISIFDGDTERVILRTDVFKVIKESGHKIVLLIRGKDRIDHYKSEFASEQVAVELLPNAGSRWETLWYYIGWNSIPTHAVQVRRYRERTAGGSLALYVLGGLAGFLGHARWWREFLRWIYMTVGPGYAGALFDKYKPDLLFAANMFSPEDTRLLREARKRGVRSITIAKSWDVLTTKAFTRVKADRMVVYNEFNREEAIAIGDYEPGQIIVTGFPQFDIYTHREIFVSRETFCAQLRLDPSRRIILYGLPGDWKSPDTRAVLAELDKRIKADAFVKPIQILARFHPKYRDSSEGLAGSHIIFDRPGEYFGATGEKGIDTSVTATNRWTFKDADIIHLANSLYHSDAVINVDSTLTLDAAALDKPSIIVAYDGDRTLPYKKSIAYIYEREHYQNVLKTGYPTLVRSHDELVKTINAIESESDYRPHEREELKRKLIFKTDGESGKRMGEAILSSLPN